MLRISYFIQFICTNWSKFECFRTCTR